MSNSRRSRAKPRSGHTLSASTGSWAGTEPFSYAYQWELCNGAGEGCANISGATGTTYPLGLGDGGGTLRVLVTAKNSVGSIGATSPASPMVPRAVRVTEYSYDADGNLQSRTNGNGDTTTYAYDPDDEQTKVTEPGGATTETGYDADGLVISQTDGSGNTTKYTRNVLGEVTEVTDSLGRKTTKEYDPAGNLTSLTDPEGRTTSYSYDAANRLTEVSYSDGKTPAVKYEYNADGDRTKIIDGTGTSTYAYDQLDHPTEATDGYGDTVGYEYNLDNQPTKVTYPNGKAVERSYDADGRLAAVTDWLGEATSFSYDPDSELTAITFPAGTGESDHYAYDDGGLMSEASFAKGSETLASLAYARDPEGNVTKTVAKGLPGGETTEYEYDEDGRLSTVNGVERYAYDAAGNIEKDYFWENIFDSADELTSSFECSLPLHCQHRSFAYNEEGERTKATPNSGPATTYGHNQAEELTSVSRPEEEEGSTPKIEDSYAYNGEGLRITETISGITNYLTWDTAEELPTMLSDGTDSFIYGPGGLPIEQINNGTGTVQYLHHDQQGSTRLLTSTRAKLWAGAATRTTGARAAKGQPRRHWRMTANTPTRTPA